MTLILSSSIAIILAAPLICRWFPRACGYLLALWPAGIALLLLQNTAGILAGEPLRYSIEWLPALGLNLSFYIDGLALLFALMVSVIGSVILVYARSYLGDHAYLTRFYVVLLIFISAMLGVVCSGNLLGLFVFWELTGIASYLLIGFNHEDKGSRDAALQALLITTAGGLALFAGLLLMGSVGNSFNLEDLLGRGGEFKSNALYVPILLLVLAGAFTKSAQFPFHFWLPQAMAAPTPISAYLHSATMVKLGVFLLARMYPILGETWFWTVLVTLIGGITMVMGALRSPFQDDLKAILAWSTLSVLGMLTFLLGIGGPYALTALVLLVLAHALYKAPLFLLAGNIDHETGTRSIKSLGGLRHKMPKTFLIGLLAAISMIGLPPTLGFVGKEALLEAVWQHSPLAVIAVLLTGVGLMAAAWMVGIKPFLGPLLPTPGSPHEAPPAMWVGPVLLTLAGLLFGITGSFLLQPVVGSVVATMVPASKAPQVSLWHGLTPPLLLSLLILILGSVFIAFSGRLSKLLPKTTPQLDRLRPSHLYRSGYKGFLALAGRLTAFIQSESLQVNLSIILWSFLLLGGVTLWRLGGLPGVPDLELQWLEVGLGLLMVAASLAAIFARSMMNAAILLGVAGFTMSAVFLLYGAVDLAITQIVVDTLTLLLFVLVVHKLPRFTRISSKSCLVHDVLLAGASGLFLTLLILMAGQVDVHQSISGFFNENSLDVAHGRNIVNVILVDFRALDTLGEITVLAIAALGVMLLLRGSTAKTDKGAL